MIQSHSFHSSRLSNRRRGRWNWWLLIVGELFNRHSHYLYSYKNTLKEWLNKFLTPVPSNWWCDIDIIIIRVLNISVESKFGKLKIWYIVIFDFANHSSCIEIHFANDKHSIKKIWSHGLVISRTWWWRCWCSRITLDYGSLIDCSCYCKNKCLHSCPWSSWADRNINSKESRLYYLKEVGGRDWVVILRELNPLDYSIVVNHCQNWLLSREVIGTCIVNNSSNQHVLSCFINIKTCYFIVDIACCRI